MNAISYKERLEAALPGWLNVSSPNGTEANRSGFTIGIADSPGGSLLVFVSFGGELTVSAHTDDPGPALVRVLELFRFAIMLEDMEYLRKPNIVRLMSETMGYLRAF
jgi:hypothetical protein